MFDTYVKFFGKPVIENNPIIYCAGEYLGTMREPSKKFITENDRTETRILGSFKEVVTANTEAYLQDPEGCEKRARAIDTLVVLNSSSLGKTLIGLFAGQEVVIDDDKILSHQTSGVVRGFLKNASGNIICYIDWMEGLPPISVSVSKVKPKAPRKSYMVQRLADMTVMTPSLNRRDLSTDVYASDRGLDRLMRSTAMQGGYDVGIYELVKSSNRLGVVTEL